MSKFRNLYYTPKDQMLFWVAGYTADNNTDSIPEIIQSLTENAQAFADHVGCDFKHVKTLYNNHPPRYQYMRVFYIKTDTPHPDAFVWNGDGEWTMGKVLTN